MTGRQLKLADIATDYQILADKVWSAMESGNPAAARLVLKENEESFADEVKRIRREVQIDYGIRV